MHHALARTLSLGASALAFVIALTSPASAQAPFETSNGWITTPEAEGWACSEQNAAEGGVEVTLVKCKPAAEEPFFFLLAKDYTVQADQVMTAEALVEDVYKASYVALFDTVTFEDLAFEPFGSAEAVVLRLEATHESRGAVQKEEWIVVVDEHVLIISAEGSPEAFELYTDAIDAWFRDVSFATL